MSIDRSWQPGSISGGWANGTDEGIYETTNTGYIRKKFEFQDRSSKINERSPKPRVEYSRSIEPGESMEKIEDPYEWYFGKRIFLLA